MSGTGARRMPALSPGIPDPGARIAALDVTRAVAIIGMMASHLLPAIDWLPGSVLTAATHGFPSTLFGVVAGVTTVVAADRPTSAGRGTEAIGAQMARGLTVALVGVVLMLVPTFVAVVLVPLGVAILLAAPLLRASIPALAAVAVGLAIGGPILIARIDDTSRFSGAGPVESTVTGVLFIGIYPVITWIVFVIAGMLVGRVLLAAIRHGSTAALGLRLALAGASALVVASLVDTWYVTSIAAPARAAGDPSALPGIIEALRESGYGVPHGTGLDAILIAAPHTGTTLDLVRTIGGAALVIGVVLLLVGGGAARSGPTRVLAAAGGAAFTMYVLHIVTTSALTIAADSGAIPWQGALWDALAIGALVIDLMLMLALGALLAILGARGPFEMLVRSAGRLGARIARRVSRQPVRTA